MSGLRKGFGAHRADWKVFWRLVSLLRPHWKRCTLAAAILPLIAAASAATPVIVRVVIDDHVAVGDLSGALRGLGLLGAAVLVLSVLKYLNAILIFDASAATLATLRSRLLNHMLDLPALFHERQETGRLLTRLTSDTFPLGRMYVSALWGLVREFIALPTILGILFWMDWALALVLAAVLPLVTFFTWSFLHRMRKTARKSREALASLGASLQESLAGLDFIQATGARGRTIAEVSGLQERLMGADFRVGGYSLLFGYATVPLLVLTLTAVAAWGSLRVIDGHTTMGTLVAFLTYTPAFFMSAGSIIGSYQGYSGEPRVGREDLCCLG